MPPSPPNPPSTPASEPAPQYAPPIESEEDAWFDGDSAYSEPASLSTTSLGSSVLGFTYENGRRYHRYRDGQYPLPNDEKEQDRLDLFHHIHKLLLKGELFCAPLPPNTQRVLDFGTGTGIWALDFADQFPAAEVIGCDLSPIQPQWVAPNCKFVVDDVEAPWTYQPNEAFDFIHGRGMGGSIANWSQLYSEIYQHLKPGGVLEMQEFEGWVRSDDDPELANASNVLRLLQEVDKASIQFGKQINIAANIKQGMIDAGFEDVTDVVHKLPVGPWPKDPKLKEIGFYQRVQMLDGIESYTMAFLTRVLGWSVEAVQVLLAHARNELRSRQNHLYTYVHFVHGKKPLLK